MICSEVSRSPGLMAPVSCYPNHVIVTVFFIPIPCDDSALVLPNIGIHACYFQFSLMLAPTEKLRP
jgi:hypothetical protein